MSKISTIISEGNWYKGNLHCHTTCSDGKDTPLDTVQIYKKNGYQFLGISDHSVYNHFTGFGTKDFLLMPATERDVSVSGEIMKCYHIVGIGYDREPNNQLYSVGEKFAPLLWNGTETAQGIIDDLNAHTNMAILAHPVWSRNELEEIKALNGLVGIEIYNNVCEIEWHQGYSELYWDLLLKHGYKVWGFATDDSHDIAKHACGGWIVVKAKELTYAAIQESIVCGSFYSSTGPQIYDFYVEDHRAVVDCSPVHAIHFITYDNLGKSYYGNDDQDLTGETHALQGVEKFVRVEIVDSNGKKAWSNPILL